MNNATTLSTLILGIALVVSAFFVSSAIKSFGGSLERAASKLRPTDIPSQCSVSLDFGNHPLRVESKSLD